MTLHPNLPSAAQHDVLALDRTKSATMARRERDDGKENASVDPTSARAARQAMSGAKTAAFSVRATS
jgi:hypothetical protein